MTPARPEARGTSEAPTACDDAAAEHGAPAPRPQTRLRNGRRGGFTLVEVLLVSAVLGIVTRIAIPNVTNVLARARATEILADVNAVKLAAHQHASAHMAFPDDTPEGVVPSTLEPFLAEGFDFVRDGYVLDWERWDLPQGLPGRAQVNRIYGITIIVEDPALRQALPALVGGSPNWFVVGNAFTFIVEVS